MSAFVYVITHLPSKRHYVGKAKNPKARWQQHLRGHATRRSYIQRALKAHPHEEFQFQVVEEHDSDAAAYEDESWWIQFLRSNVEAYGYNLSAGGEGSRGHSMSDENRRKASERSKARWAKPGAREQQAALTKALHTGLKRPAITGQRVSAALKGHPTSEEHRRKISEASKGKPRPWMRAVMKGVPKSEEHRRKIGLAHKGMKRSEQAKANMRAGHARRRAEKSAADSSQMPLPTSRSSADS